MGSYTGFQFLNPLMGGGYIDKVLGFKPIAYWPLNETSGTVAKCLVNSAQNGVYNSNVSGWPPATGIGDGQTAPYFDGTNDLVNVQTATFTGRFNGQLGSMFCWYYPDILSHNDGVIRYLVEIYVADTNYVLVSKTGVNSNILYTYRAGGNTQSQTYTQPTAPTGFQFVGMSWNFASNLVQYYHGATLIGTDPTPAAWAGLPIISIIGASTLVPANVFYGRLAHIAVFDRALQQADINVLAVV